MAVARALTPDELPVGWLRLDVRGVIEAANPRIAAWTGQPVESLLGKSFDTLLTPGSRLLYQCHVQPLLRLHADTAELSIALRAADGGEMSALLYSCPAGRNGVDLVIAPIKQRRKIEDELLRVKRAGSIKQGRPTCQVVENALCS